MKNKILSDIEQIYGRMQKHAQYLQNNAESGFKLEKTYKYVFDEIRGMGLEPQKCGKCGIRVDIKGNESGKTFLLRADMDALTGIDPNFPENTIHACGHHFHTAMLLGAAELITKNIDMLCGNVRLMFQAAEETLEGAADMIANGILEAPIPDAAMMVHVLTGVDIPCGKIVVCSDVISAPSADFFRISIKGRGAHGALAHQGVDALSVSAYILTALNEINARELSLGENAAITIGKLEGASVANVIPDTVCLEGSLRSFCDDTRERIIKRVDEISQNIAHAFRAEAMLEITSSCPSLKNDKLLSKYTFDSLSEIFGDDKVINANIGEGRMSGGSEDFSYVSQRIPSIMIAICAGNKTDGYDYPLHHPKVRFDERALTIGAVAYAYTAIKFLGN